MPQQQLGQRKDEKPTQHKDHPSQIQGVPRARRCRRTPQHSRHKLTGESAEESPVNIFLRLGDFHDAPIIKMPNTLICPPSVLQSHLPSRDPLPIIAVR